MQREDIPDIYDLIKPMLGTPYDTCDCWALARHLYIEGLDIPFHTVMDASGHFTERWFNIDPDPPVIAAWDFLVFSIQGQRTDHIGTVVNGEEFVHSRRRPGVCIEHLNNGIFLPHLIQVCRPNILV